MLEQSLRRHFEQQDEAELLPAQVTVAELLRQGRLRRRWHRIGAVGAPALAAVVVAAIAMTGALSSGTLGRTGPQADGHGRVTGGLFDPSYLAIGLGWLPADAVVTGGQLSPGGEALSAAAPHGRVWAVGVYARNLCQVSKAARQFDCPPFVNGPTLPLGTTLSISGRGPVIDGHRSLWLHGGVSRPAGPGTRGVYDGTILAWQYAPGAWTVVQFVSSQGGATAEVRIARAVEYGQHVPVRFTSRFTSLPGGWRISGLFFARDDGGYLVSTYKIARASTNRLATTVFAGALDEPDITISPATSTSRCDLDPHIPQRQVTIHGYQFIFQSQAIGVGGKPDMVWSYLCGNHVDGLLVGVTEFSGGRPTGIPLTNVMERMQLLGTNPADWVTNPLP
jgi:hypothetical protein